MQICSEIGGFTLKEADDVRRAMGKKKRKVLAQYLPKFIKGSEEQGISKEVANKIWRDLSGFADYCLAGDTKVITKEYGPVKIKTIVDLRLPCTVYSLDDNDNIVEQPVIQYWNHGVKKCNSYQVDDVILRATPDHSFKTTEGMQEIQVIAEQGLHLLRGMKNDECTNDG